MTRKDFTAAGLVALLALPALGGAQTASSPWLHIRVEEQRRSSKVHVNLPLTVVEAALKAAPDTVASGGRIHLGCSKDVSVADLRRIWRELKNAGDTEIVSVENDDETVKVARKGELVIVRVDKRGREEVNVEVPVAIVDALFSADGDELDVKAAVRELQKRRGDIVRVTDEDTTVRIWIDEKG